MDIIECISNVFSGLKSPNYKELKEVIQSLHLTTDQLQPYLVEPAALGYGRNVLYLNEDVEVVLIHMPGNRQTQLHDHGGSIGCIYVVEGELVNRMFQYNDNDQQVLVSEDVSIEGDFLKVTEEDIHLLKNPSSQPFISFHVYSPPLKNIKLYDYTMHTLSTR